VQSNEEYYSDKVKLMCEEVRDFQQDVYEAESMFEGTHGDPLLCKSYINNLEQRQEALRRYIKITLGCKDLLIHMLRQQAPVHCEEREIGSNILWDLKKDVSTAEDVNTGQKIFAQKLFKSHSVTVRLFNTRNSDEGNLRCLKSFKMKKNSTAQQLLKGIYRGYEGVEDLQGSMFEALTLDEKDKYTWNLFPGS
jgi:hypothetical protein